MSEKLEQNIAELKKANLELKKDIDKKRKARDNENRFSFKCIS
ncbi:MAG: hypothetical protein ACLUZ6_00140 [Lachnospira eligens]